MPEVRIKTDFGEVVIPYNNIEELENGLKEIEKVVELVSSKAANIIKKESVQQKTGFEDLFSLTSDGLVEIKKAPDSEVKTVALVLFAYHPNGASTKQISKSSGVGNVSSRILTHSAYKKYFRKLGKKNYGLSQEGLEFVTKEIIPKLRGKEKEE